ncbi:MAG: cell division protein FtsZ [Desulfovibrio sp.]|jgi:cell division protein FtsZ|nr:cell division protein FtsZ [Desulfovibrio sp.]
MEQSIVDDIEEISLSRNAKLKVIGVGGGGGNAVQTMIDKELRGVHFVCANTDLQALTKNQAPHKLQLGERLTKGLGAGADPEVGRKAALESLDGIKEAIGDADMVFVTAGMGGGTGTGAAPLVAKVAREMGVLTVGIVTKPFTFEGAKRSRHAAAGLEEFRQHVDSLIVIPNDRLLALAAKKASFLKMLEMANDVLYHAVKGISDVILGNGLINLDFADVKTIMAESGLALMSTGAATGENRAKEATQRAIMSPLLEDVSLESARAILYNVTATDSITQAEVQEVGEIIAGQAHNSPNIIFGVAFDDKAGEELRVTVIATGIESPSSVRVPDVDDTKKPLGGAKVTRFSDANGGFGRSMRDNQAGRGTQGPGTQTGQAKQAESPWYEKKGRTSHAGVGNRAVNTTLHGESLSGNERHVYDNISSAALGGKDDTLPAFLMTQPN